MGVLTHAMVQTMTLLNTSTDGYGDQVGETGTDYPCKFREITELDQINNREMVTTTDAMLWVEADTPVVKGSIVKIEDEKYRVDRLTKARRIESADVLFIKCLLEKYHGDPNS